MKAYFIKALVASLCAAPAILWAAPQMVLAGKDMGAISSGDSRQCGFCTLVGVGEADSLVSHSPWFTISQARTSYKPMVA